VIAKDAKSPVVSVSLQAAIFHKAMRLSAVGARSKCHRSANWRCNCVEKRPVPLVDRAGKARIVPGPNFGPNAPVRTERNLDFADYWYTFRDKAMGRKGRARISGPPRSTAPAPLPRRVQGQEPADGPRAPPRPDRPCRRTRSEDGRAVPGRENGRDTKSRARGFRDRTCQIRQAR
jgi:hypothetical protein